MSGEAKKPSRGEVLAVLRDEVKVQRHSYKEADGIVRDPGALYRIDCLKRAIELLKEGRAG